MNSRLPTLLRSVGFAALLAAAACGNAAPAADSPESAAQAIDSLRLEVDRLSAALTEAGVPSEPRPARGLLSLPAVLVAILVIAVAVAAQDVLRNLLGGLVIRLARPFRVGDRIGVAGATGGVVAIGWHSTRIATTDHGMVTVPNARLLADRVSNDGPGSSGRPVAIDLYLPGWADGALSRRVARQVAASSKYVDLDRPVVVLVRDEFQETFLTHLEVRAHVIDARFEPHFRSDVTERARTEFRRLGLAGAPFGAGAP